MKHAARWGVLFVLCVLGTPEQAQAQAQPQVQPSVCDGDYVCISDPLATASAGRDTASAAVEPTSLAHLERCPGAPVDVTAASHEERSLACSAADDAIQLLGRCEIPLRRPLRLQIMNEVRHPFSREPIFGLFDIGQERVLITREALIGSLAEGTPYTELPQRDLYRSLIVHEIVHGIMHQNLRRPAASHAAYEYPAYALQVASLPSDVRDKLLRAIPDSARSGELVLSDAILFFDPYFFAVRAYAHFKSAANECAQLHVLLDGEAPFIRLLPP